ncbi:MAG: hypothetical protein KBC81_02670 [Candidatus Pacebacteria bacterium]|nr:hypothetical protein [Candidatus Paceibacterota bacterium]
MNKPEGMKSSDLFGNHDYPNEPGTGKDNFCRNGCGCMISASGNLVDSPSGNKAVGPCRMNPKKSNG